MQMLFERNLEQRKQEEEKQTSSKKREKIDTIKDSEDDEYNAYNAEGKEGDGAGCNVTSNSGSNFEKIYGVLGTESAISSHIRASKEWFSKKSGTQLRNSIAGKFRQRRGDTSSSYM